MDNASKALIMAGAVLIALLVISVFLYAINQYSKYMESMSAIDATVEAESFNRYYLYAAQNGGTITGFDAYNVMAKALDMNVNIEPQNRITVTFKGSTITNISQIAQLKDIDHNLHGVEANYVYTYRWGTDGKINQIIIN